MRKICVVTGTRAEYGLLYWLIREIEEDLDLQLQLVVTGMHLSPEFGLTYQQIEQDGFEIDEKVEMLLSSDTAVGITKSLGLGVIGFADVLDRLKPDILVLLGDRYEILAVAQAAMIARIPIAHIHGGERTEGLIDEAIRHSLTKMAHLHFVAAEEYRKRVIQLGEQPDHVFNVGAMGLENIRRLTLLDRAALEKSLQFQLGKINFLVTYHPETLSQESPEQQIEEILLALSHFPEAKIIFTRANADPAGRAINQKLEHYCSLHQENTKLFTSLGQIRYLSMVKQADLVLGNSSSGIIEVPFLKKSVINIGNRQEGRLKASTVIDCFCKCEEIKHSIEIALSKDFQEKVGQLGTFYGNGDSARQIKQIMKDVNLRNILMKKFYDMGP